MPSSDNPATSTATAPFTAESFPAKPDLECDIVMKGGITSGVIYPQAVCELAQTYGCALSVAPQRGPSRLPRRPLRRWARAKAVAGAERRRSGTLSPGFLGFEVSGLAHPEAG